MKLIKINYNKYLSLICFFISGLEITPSFLTMVESGQRGVSLDLVEKISCEFEIPIAILFVETNNIDGKNLSYFRNAELDTLQKKLILQISDLIKASVEELKN